MEPLIVGITGPSCAGKTTLIRKIVGKIGEERVDIIHLDDYWDRDFKPEIVEGYKNRETPENLKLNLFFSHLSSIKKGKSVEIPFNVFELENGEKSSTKTIEPKPIVIVEGFLLFYDERIRDLFDLKVYLDLSDEEVLKRRVKRNRSGKSLEIYYRRVVVSEYRKYGFPAKKHCDLVLDALESPDKNSDLIIEKLKDFSGYKHLKL